MNYTDSIIVGIWKKEIKADQKLNVFMKKFIPLLICFFLIDTIHLYEDVSYAERKPYKKWVKWKWYVLRATDMLWKALVDWMMRKLFKNLHVQEKVVHHIKNISSVVLYPTSKTISSSAHNFSLIHSSHPTWPRPHSRSCRAFFGESVLFRE